MGEGADVAICWSYFLHFFSMLFNVHHSIIEIEQNRNKCGKIMSKKCEKQDRQISIYGRSPIIMGEGADVAICWSYFLHFFSMLFNVHHSIIEIEQNRNKCGKIMSKKCKKQDRQISIYGPSPIWGNLFMGT